MIKQLLPPASLILGIMIILAGRGGFAIGVCLILGGMLAMGVIIYKKEDK